MEVEERSRLPLHSHRGSHLPRLPLAGYDGLSCPGSGKPQAGSKGWIGSGRRLEYQVWGQRHPTGGTFALSQRRE